MALITEDDVKKVAALARLGLTDEEVAAATKDLAGILKHFSTIQDIPTDDVPTYDDASGLHNVTAADQAEPGELASESDLVGQAPDQKDGQVKVKSVF